MTRRDWVLAGTAYLFIGAGLSAWMLGGDLPRTILGALPMLLGLTALHELVQR